MPGAGPVYRLGRKQGKGIEEGEGGAGDAGRRRCGVGKEGARVLGDGSTRSRVW